MSGLIKMISPYYERRRKQRKIDDENEKQKTK